MKHLSIIAWNICIEQEPDAVRSELAHMIDKHDPDVFVLTEASRLFGRLDGLGYTVHHLEPKPLHEGNVPEQADTAILVREVFKVTRGAMHMTKCWRGPKAGRDHDPRTYPWVRIQANGASWKIGGFHLPFGKEATDESDKNIKAWFRAAQQNQPIIAVGDMNMGKAELHERIADEVSARVAGLGIDLAAFRNCHADVYEDLGKHGSDHPAIRYEFRTK